MVTGGGTGGHLYPALAVTDALRGMCRAEILFVGTQRGLEARILPRPGIGFRTVWISGLRRGRVVSNLLFPLKMMVSLMQCMRLVRRFHPHVIFGTGGYVSWPVLAAGWLAGVPLVIQEQNRTPGLVTKVTAPLARSIHLSYESSLSGFHRKDRCHVSGNPTRDDLEIESADYDFGLKEGGKVVFVFGGSQGSRNLNESILPGLPTLMKNPGIRLLWSAGPRWYRQIEARIKPYGNRIRVYPYIDDMGSAYGLCNLVVCRAGATTVAEITRLGLPSILVPFESAAGGHQRDNALALVYNGAADMVPEKDALKGVLIDRIEKWIKDDRGRRTMARAAKSMGRPAAASEIALDLLAVSGLIRAGGNRKGKDET